MGIVIAQRTAVIRGTEVTQSSSAENSYVENLVSNPSLPEMNAMETKTEADSLPRLASAQMPPEPLR